MTTTTPTPTPTLPITIAPGATTPTRSHPTDAGLDLYAHGEHKIDLFTTHTKVHTGIAAAIPAGNVGLLFPRSSFHRNYNGATLANQVGVIDSGYNGEIIASIKPGYAPATIQDGDKIVQLVIVPTVNLPIEVVDTLPDTERGAGAFGSTGSN